VRVRAKIDARYYTDDTLPYTTGLIRGAGAEGEEVLTGGHNHEWGASDNASGCACALEAAGIINDLVREGVLRKPQRGVRVWIGSEIHGSLAFAVDNLDRLNKKTVASIVCDDGGGDYDRLVSILTLVMNPDCMPTYTDALLAEIARRYYAAQSPPRLFRDSPYQNADNLFCDPMIGVPSNWIYMSSGNDLHHSSKDTIDKLDPRSLRDVSVIAALYLYYIADAGFEDIAFLADITRDRGMGLVLDEYRGQMERLRDAADGASLGRLHYEGSRAIIHNADVREQAVYSIGRIVPPGKRQEAHSFLEQHASKIDKLGALLAGQLADAAKERAKALAVSIAPYKPQAGAWEKEAAGIVPRRNHIGVISLQGIPSEEWVEVRSDPHWWGATTWPSSSLWWCDGRRNLNEIRDLCELEAGEPVRNFDLVKYYRFLEKHGLVEFVGSR
jgi:hypothetical protein